MSQQQSLEQKRAAEAWECIQIVKERNGQLEEKKRFAKEYGSLVKGAPADIQATGLGQTLAFWRAKGHEWSEARKQSEPKKDNAHAQLLAHVSSRLRGQKILPDNKDVVEWIAKEALTNDYRRATTEAIAFLNWLKRFAEAELPKGE